MQCDPESRIGVPDQGQFFERTDVNSEFLLDFSHHRMFRVLPLIDFASGKLPKTRHETGFGPFLAKNAAVPNDHPNRDLYGSGRPAAGGPGFQL